MYRFSEAKSPQKVAQFRIHISQTPLKLSTGTSFYAHDLLHLQKLHFVSISGCCSSFMTRQIALKCHCITSNDGNVVVVVRAHFCLCCNGEMKRGGRGEIVDVE